MIVTLLICLTVIYLAHFASKCWFKEHEWKDNVALSAVLEKGLKDLAEVKASVDTLKLRAGFKL